jgi:hypothetical protein
MDKDDVLRQFVIERLFFILNKIIFKPHITTLEYQKLNDYLSGVEITIKLEDDPEFKHMRRRHESYHTLYNQSHNNLAKDYQNMYQMRDKKE